MFEFNNYRRNLSVDKDKNLIVLPWACVAIKNCKDDGEFLKFKNTKKFKDQAKSLWLLLELMIFRDAANLFPGAISSKRYRALRRDMKKLLFL